jgi:hypothetical protein
MTNVRKAAAAPYQPKIDHVDQLGSAHLGGFHCCRGLLQSIRSRLRYARFDRADRGTAHSNPISRFLLLHHCRRHHRYKPTAAARWASLFIIRATSITPSPLQSGHVFVPCGRLRKPSMWPDDHTREEIATASELAKRIYADAAIASVLHEQATSPGKASIA